MHKLLARQIKHYVKNKEDLEKLNLFLQVVDEAYTQFDESYIMLERSLEFTSNELLKRNKELSKTLEQLHETNDELKTSLENLKLAQDQLIESGKMAALGHLVAGVAHEVNTPLGICVAAVSELNSTVNSLNEAFRESDKQKKINDFISSYNEGIKLIETNLTRASELIKSFKQISVDNAIDQYREINLKEYLDQIILSLKPAVKKTHLKIVLECPPDLIISTYTSAIFQVITILVMNSIDHGYKAAVPGTLTLKVESTNDKIYVHYYDDGKGIAPEVLPKIFEPFFTTRRGLNNTGLGLSIAYNLVVQSLKGSIRCTSTLGEGAHFYIEFPKSLSTTPT